MSRGIFWLILAAGLMAVRSRASAAPSGQLVLAQGGETNYQIVTHDRATPPQRHAAEELASFLKQISGADFPVVRQADWSGGPAIFVGVSPAARRAAPGLDLRGLGHDGLVIRTSPPHLLLMGGEPRGTLYAVYTFLEDYLGCRWWTSTASTIPQRSTIKLGPINDRQVPLLEYREPFFADAFDGDWAVRNKANGASARLDAARGGKITYQGFVHTFASLVPLGEYFAEHPEWFAFTGGKRSDRYAQLCLTNDELKRFVAERVKEWLRANPTADIVSVSQNDGGGYCECPNCKALDEKEGSHAGSLLHFVNYVAREVGKEFPNVAIDTLAYTYTRKLPKYVRPEPNVIVRLCSIECNFARPLTDPSNRAFYQDLVGWSKVCKRLYVWDYVTNFSHYLWPQPNVFVLGPNVRTFVAHGVRGIFEQGSYTTLGGDMALLKAWVLAKLLWNPDRDADALIREFLNGYYGPAGPYVGKYLDLVHREAVDHKYYLGCFVRSDSPFPSSRTVKAAEEAFRQGLAAVAGQPELQQRVQLAHLPLTYVQLSRGWEPQANGAIAYEQLIQDFESVVRRENIVGVSEGGPVAPKVAEFRENLRVYREVLSIGPGETKVWPLPNTWKFAPDPKEQGEAAGWFKEGFDDGTWAAVRSDRNCGWEAQGFPDYTGFGWYRQAAAVPADVAGFKHLYLYFGSVDDDAWVYLNGQLAYEHSSKTTGLPPQVIWRTPFAFDPRPWLKLGATNAIAVKVLNRVGMGGVYRPVYLVGANRELDVLLLGALVARETAE
jgi:hypothetical protein